MPEVEVTAGRIAYQDSGGDGPVVVLIPGLLMDWKQWRKVIDELAPEFRCVSPSLPTGAHWRPMKPDADLSLVGMGRIVTEFLAAAQLDDVTLCFNDWCGAQVMIANDGMDRVAKLVLVSCETAGNYPPGLAGFAAWLSAKLPGGYVATRGLLLQPRLRRLPFVFGQMTKRGVPDELMRDWMEPLRKKEIRRDLRRYAGDAMRGKHDLARATASLPSFEKPVLVVWDEEGKMMPNEAGRALADSFPNSRYVELPDCFTLIPEDQPEALAREIRAFAAGEPQPSPA